MAMTCFQPGLGSSGKMTMHVLRTKISKQQKNVFSSIYFPTEKKVAKKFIVLHLSTIICCLSAPGRIAGIFKHFCISHKEMSPSNHCQTEDNNTDMLFCFIIVCMLCTGLFKYYYWPASQPDRNDRK